MLAAACGGLAEPLVIALSPEGLTLGIGESGTLTATILDDNEEPVTGEEVIWVSSFPEVATVSAGVVVGVAGGTSDISASIGRWSGSTRVTVIPRSTGTWVGILGSDSSSVVTLEVTESTAGAIEGIATLDIGGALLIYGVAGLHDHPDVILTWTAPGNPDLIFQGSFNGDDMLNGRLTSPGLLNNTANLIRQ